MAYRELIERKDHSYVSFFREIPFKDGECEYKM